MASASGRHHALPQCTHRKNTSSPVRRARFRVCVWQSGQGAVTMGTSRRRSGFGMRFMAPTVSGDASQLCADAGQTASAVGCRCQTRRHARRSAGVLGRSVVDSASNRGHCTERAPARRRWKVVPAVLIRLCRGRPPRVEFSSQGATDHALRIRAERAGTGATVVRPWAIGMRFADPAVRAMAGHQLQPFSIIAARHSSERSTISCPERQSEESCSPWPSIMRRRSQPISTAHTSQTATIVRPPLSFVIRHASGRRSGAALFQNSRFGTCMAAHGTTEAVSVSVAPTAARRNQLRGSSPELSGFIGRRRAVDINVVNRAIGERHRQMEASPWPRE